MVDLFTNIQMIEHGSEKDILAEQVALYKRTNVVQSQKFSEKIAQLMNSYYNGPESVKLALKKIVLSFASQRL